MFGTSPVELMAANAMLQGQVYCENFTYSAQWIGANAIGANASVDQQIQVNSDSDFVVQDMHYATWNADGPPQTANYTPDMSLNVVLAGSGRQIFDRPQHIMNEAGNYWTAFPGFQFPFPRIVQSNTTITLTLTDLAGVAQSRTYLNFTGFKVFYLTGSRQSVFHVL